MRAMNAKTSLPDVLLRAVLELPRVDNVNILFRVKYFKKKIFFFGNTLYKGSRRPPNARDIYF